MGSFGLDPRCKSDPLINDQRFSVQEIFFRQSKRAAVVEPNYHSPEPYTSKEANSRLNEEIETQSEKVIPCD